MIIPISEGRPIVGECGEVVKDGTKFLYAMKPVSIRKRWDSLFISVLLTIH